MAPAGLSTGADIGGRCAVGSGGMQLVPEIILFVTFGGFALLSVGLTIIDLGSHRLPNTWVAASAAVGVLGLGTLALSTGRGLDLLRCAAAAVVLFVAYLALRLISRGGVGGGDVKLAAVLGWYLGWFGWNAVLVGTAVAFILGGVFAIGAIAGRGGSRSVAVPFGPGMLGGAWIAIALAWS